MPKKHHHHHHHHADAPRHHRRDKHAVPTFEPPPTIDEEETYFPPTDEEAPPSVWKKRLLIMIVLLSCALAVALGVGLTVGRGSSSSGGSAGRLPGYLPNSPFGVPQNGTTYNSVLRNQPNQVFDVYGRLLTVHDGNIIRHPPSGLYLMVGVVYGECREPFDPSTNLTRRGGNGGIGAPYPGSTQYFGGCQADSNGIPGGAPYGCGSQVNHNVSAWWSPDLATWTPVHGPGPEGAIIMNMAKDWPIAPVVAYLAKGLWNPINNEFVVWLFLNAVPGGNGSYGVIRATDPTGDWTIVTTYVDTLGILEGSDDVAFWQDKTPPYNAYFSYTAYADEPAGTSQYGGHYVFVEKMQGNYYGTLGKAAWSGPDPLFTYTEAQSLFIRNGQYCMSKGVCSCYGYDAQKHPARIIPSSFSHTVCCVFSASSFNDTLSYISCSSSPYGPFAQGVAFSAAVSGQQASISSYYDANGVEQFLWWQDQWVRLDTHNQRRSPVCI